MIEGRSRLVRRVGPLGVGLLLALGAVTVAPRSAHAENMISSFIRIDSEPQADDKKGTPAVPMLVELGTPTPVTSFQEGCFTGGAGTKVTAANLSCMSSKIEKDGYEKQFEFPKDNATILAKVGEEEYPMEVLDAVPFKDATAANAGIAWLILMDASSSVDVSRWTEQQDAAEQIIKSMGANDAVMVRIMDDKSVRVHTSWLGAGSKQKAITAIRSVPKSFGSGGKVDALISRIEKESLGSFQELFDKGVEGNEDQIPILQSIVILSDGSDSSPAGFGSGAEAKVLHDKLSKGNDLGSLTDFTRLPVPVITLWFPDPKLTGGLANTDEIKTDNAFQWMSNLATPEVGGYFDIIQAGEAGKGAKIARIIRNRFDNMYYVSAAASCLAPTTQQTFTMAFTDTKSKIAPAKWEKIGIAFNFAKWVLDVDKKKTEAAAAAKPLQIGTEFDIFGNFCWGSNAGQAEAYFLTEADAPEVKKAVADKTGKKGVALLQNLQAKGQKAETLSVTPNSGHFRVPNTPALFPEGKDSFFLNVVVFDNKAKRVSTLDQKGVFQLKAVKAPVNKLLIVGAIGGGVVLILLIAILARSGGGGNGRSSKRRRGGAPAPGPMPGQPPGPIAPAIISRPPPGPAPPLPPMAPVGVPVVSPPTAPAPSPMFPASPGFAQSPPVGGVGGTAIAPFSPPPAIGGGTAFMSAAANPPAAQTEAVPLPNVQPSPVVTAWVPPPVQVPPMPQKPASMPPPSFAAGHANVTVPPANVPQVGGPLPAADAPRPGLHAQQKGATSFPTTCPNPACRKQVMIPPGGSAQCAFCGTLVDASGVAASPIQAAGGFGLTGHVSPEAAERAAGGKPVTALLEPQPYAPSAHAATLVGKEGTFRILPGIESRVGRDGTLCSIALGEPRVSGVHATLKLEGGTLFVRDDRSHNGTYVNGNRVSPGVWTPVPGGSQLKFGPAEFAVRHEG